MIKIPFLMMTLAMPLLANIQFKCVKNNQTMLPCNKRKTIEMTSFDPTLTHPLQSNWYVIKDSDSVKSVTFWDDEIWSKTRQRYRGFGVTQHTAHYGRQKGFYQIMDTMIHMDTPSKRSLKSELVMRVYAFNQATTTVATTKTTHGYTIQKNGQNPSIIQFGTDQYPCQFSLVSQKKSNDTITHRLAFNHCHVTVTATDTQKGTAHQFHTDFNDFKHVFESTSNDTSASKGMIERPLLNVEGYQIGYLQFNFFNNYYTVVDNHRHPFRANNDPSPHK
ncbi:MAG: hypothetical protein ACO3K7_01700 [Candidatus Marinamargulisbacteria bacterium]